MGKFSKKIFGNIEVSYIIVNYNGAEYLESCINSVKSQSIDGECIVVDNGSTDNSRNILDDFNVRKIFNGNNLGYPKAVNQGIRASSGSFVFLLTPTTFLEEETTEILLEKFEDDRAGAVVPKLLTPDGDTVRSIRRIPEPLNFFWEITGLTRLFSRSRWINSWKQPDFDYEKEGVVEQPMSCAMLVDRECFEEIGFFDESFFLYFSDVDFAKRLNRQRRIIYCPDSNATHIRGGITSSDGPDVVLLFHRDLIQYLKKHHRFALIFLGVPVIVSGEIRYLFLKIRSIFRVKKPD